VAAPNRKAGGLHDHDLASSELAVVSHPFAS
jgi:hypothetical protein